MSSEKVVLAYSGGLDTCFCIPFLKEQGYEVHALHVNTGGFSDEEVEELKVRALQLGALSCESINNESEYYADCLRYLLYGNVLRNNTYPLSVSSERVFQAIAVLEYCKEIGATHVAHGSTGAGNDQIRFDGTFESLAGDIKIITPIRDNSLSRKEEIHFLQERGFEWSEEKGAYSINQGLWGTSVGGRETLTSRHDLPEAAWPHHCTKNGSEEIEITFSKGQAIELNSQRCKHPVDLIKQLNEIGYAYAIGRDIHVGDTIIGIKGRVGFEAPAALMLIKAH